MKHLEDLLLLGNPKLYEISEAVKVSEVDQVQGWVNDLHQVMEEIRAKYHFGRAIAAPQLGIMKRVIYMNIDKPVVFINPELVYKSPDMFEVWDDCMCFPNLLVKVLRHREIVIRYRDQNWNEQEWRVKNDLSELLQHEFDHLEGILCTMRAIDGHSYRWRPTP